MVPLKKDAFLDQLPTMVQETEGACEECKEEYVVLRCGHKLHEGCAVERFDESAACSECGDEVYDILPTKVERFDIDFSLDSQMLQSRHSEQVRDMAQMQHMDCANKHDGNLGDVIDFDEKLLIHVAAVACFFNYSDACGIYKSEDERRIVREAWSRVLHSIRRTLQSLNGRIVRVARLWAALLRAWENETTMRGEELPTFQNSENHSFKTEVIGLIDYMVYVARQNASFTANGGNHPVQQGNDNRGWPRDDARLWHFLHPEAWTATSHWNGLQGSMDDGEPEDG